MAIQTVQVQRKLFSVDEYEHLIHAGIFAEDDRWELIAGEIVATSPIGSAHAGVVKRLDHTLSTQLGHRALISVQDPIRLPDSEPQPDLALLVPRADFYANALPGPGDILLVIEVADTSTEFDRAVKVPLYARSGLGEVWLVALAERVVEVYRDPAPSGYRSKQTHFAGDHLTPSALPDLRLAVADCFPA
jgi:Uma2 family endonuclease